MDTDEKSTRRQEAPEPRTCSGEADHERRHTRSLKPEKTGKRKLFGRRAAAEHGFWWSPAHPSSRRGWTMRISLGSTGSPPALDRYSGTPTQVKSSPSSGSPSRPGSRCRGTSSRRRSRRARRRAGAAGPRPGRRRAAPRGTRGRRARPRRWRRSRRTPRRARAPAPGTRGRARRASRRAHRRRQVRPAVDAGLEPVDGVHDDAVRERRRRASPTAMRAAQHALRQAAAGSIRRCEPRASTTVSTGVRLASGTVDRGAALPRRAERVAVARPLRGRDERELHAAPRRPRRRRPGRPPRAPARLAEGDDRHRPLVHPVRADQRGDRRVREAGVERRRRARPSRRPRAAGPASCRRPSTCAGSRARGSASRCATGRR